MKTRKFMVKLRGETFEVEVEEISNNENKIETEDKKNNDRLTEFFVENGMIEAPMAGKVLKIEVAKGEYVNKGELLLVLEAMKMENEIRAPKSGQVKEVSVIKGQNVETGDLLLIID